MNQPVRILVIQTAFIGDVILATALLETLHRDFPNAKLDFLVRRGNESLLNHHPFLNEVLVWDKKQGKYKSLWQLLKTIRSRRYDVVLNLQRYGATGLLTAFSGAKQTVGFDKNPVSWLFTHRVPHKFEPGVHEVDRNAALLLRFTTPNPLLKQERAIKPSVFDPKRNKGIAFEKAPSRFRWGLGVVNRPKLYPSAADVARVGPYQLEPYVCIAPTSVWFTKQFPGSQWADLINALPDNQPVYLLGAPTDTADCEAIRQQTTTPNRVVNLAGKLTLLESAALMGGAVMNYVNDSAPMHIASAMNAPTTAVFCSTVPEFGYGPLSDNSRVVQTTVLLDCRPCGIHGHRACPQGHFRCATAIKTGQLLGLIEP